MQKSARLIAKVFLLLIFVYRTAPTFADQCDDLIQQEKEILQAKSQAQHEILTRMRNAPPLGDDLGKLLCENDKVELNYLTPEVSRRRQTETVCGSRLNEVCDSNCMQEQLAEQQKQVQKSCTAPRKTPPSTSQIQVNKRTSVSPANNPSSNSNQLPYQSSNSISCGGIDVTDTGAPQLNGLVCLAGAKCRDREPYNHSRAPIQFHQFNGPDIIVKRGDSIWNIPDESNPTGRRLEARLYDGLSASSNTCAEEGTNTTVKPFIVNIGCESERQAQLEYEFEHREDVCIPRSQCKGPIKFMSGWQEYSLSYWKNNPTASIGGCPLGADPLAAGRTTKLFCVRDDNWHTSSECDNFGIASSINGRGLLGCIYNEGKTAGPVRQQANAQPDQEDAKNWLVIAGSWAADDPDTSAEARARQSVLSLQGFDAQIIHTNAYPNLSPNLTAVVVGPFNQAQAEVQLLAVRVRVSDAFIKKAF